MEIKETIYLSGRESWRNWLMENHLTAEEIWLIYPNKSSGKPCIPYDDAVREALCFGWIDTTIKKTEPGSSLQRFCPRRKNSSLSELNKERIRELVKEGKMTSAGIESIKKHIEAYDPVSSEIKFLEFILPEDILDEIRKDKLAWENFNKFPEYYKRIRLASIDSARIRPEIFRKRLDYFLRMTRMNKRFGTMK